MAWTGSFVFTLRYYTITMGSSGQKVAEFGLPGKLSTAVPSFGITPLERILRSNMMLVIR